MARLLADLLLPLLELLDTPEFGTNGFAFTERHPNPEFPAGFLGGPGSGSEVPVLLLGTKGLAYIAEDNAEVPGKRGASKPLPEGPLY